MTPVISAHHSATSRISRYLHRLLRPLMASAMRRHVFTDEANFIQKLIQYSQGEQQQLQPTTLFATIQITNAQSIVSHASLVENLAYFLQNQLIGNRIQYTSLKTPLPQYIAASTITKLTELFLQNNFFYYEGKIYEFKKGGPHSLLLSEDLLDIYLFDWQQMVSNDEQLKTELLGRYDWFHLNMRLRDLRFSHALDIAIHSFSPGINPRPRCASFLSHSLSAFQPCNCKHPLGEAYNF